MRENNLVNASIRKASSLVLYSIRAKKDTCLHNDVEYFMLRHQHSTSRLVEKLLNDDFTLARLTDSTYPL
jgi:hypothetical protein